MTIMSATIPVVELMGDAFFIQDGAQVFVIIAKGIFAADHYHNIHLSELIEDLGALEFCKIMGWCVEIDVIAVVAIEEVAKILD